MRRGVFLVLVGFLLLAGSTPGAGAGAAGISGRTVAGPTCPVQSIPPRPGCAPRPFGATVRIRELGSAAPATTVRSGADGRFRVGLHAGSYLLTALARTGSPLPRPPAPRRVRVYAGHFTFVTISYDTGIR